MYSAAAAAPGVPACLPSRAGSASQLTCALRRSTETAESVNNARTNVTMRRDSFLDFIRFTCEPTPPSLRSGTPPNLADLYLHLTLWVQGTPLLAKEGNSLHSA